MDKQTAETLTKLQAKAAAFTERAKKALKEAPAPTEKRHLDTSTRNKRIVAPVTILVPVSISVAEQAASPSLAGQGLSEAAPGVAAISVVESSVPVIAEKIETVLLSGGEIVSPTPGE